jgi:fatty acid desaturase
MEKPHHHYRLARRAPRAIRIGVGVALVLLGLLGFLPILGFWMVPLGLAVIFFEVPFVRRAWVRLRGWAKEKRRHWRDRRP